MVQIVRIPQAGSDVVCAYAYIVGPSLGAGATKLVHVDEAGLHTAMTRLGIPVDRQNEILGELRMSSQFFPLDLTDEIADEFGCRG